MLLETMCEAECELLLQVPAVTVWQYELMLVTLM